MLPTDDKARKGLPIFRGPLMYFPDALLAVAAVCKAGNDQHNPGEPLHWAREKSTEQLDTALRHMMDHGMGNTLDTDGMYHLAKAAWRILAELQLTIEKHTARAAVVSTQGNRELERDVSERLSKLEEMRAAEQLVDKVHGPVVEPPCMACKLGMKTGHHHKDVTP